LAELVKKLQNNIPASGDAAASLIKLLDVLEENDDVQNVTGNFDIAAEELEKLAG
jgi:transcriptional/translational regulatory protein YebC/TACO1